jgi:hypothetical protein
MAGVRELHVAHNLFREKGYHTVPKN